VKLKANEWWVAECRLPVHGEAYGKDPNYVPLNEHSSTGAKLDCEHTPKCKIVIVSIEVKRPMKTGEAQMSPKAKAKAKRK
jgi:hypothetical protein